MLVRMTSAVAMTLVLVAGWVWVAESQAAIVDAYRPLKRVADPTLKWEISPASGPNLRVDSTEWPIYQIRTAERMARGSQLLF